MTNNKALENAVEKIYEKIAETGEVTDNQLLLIATYNRINKVSPEDSLISSGTKILTVIDNFMSGGAK